jgi:UDP-N-acetylglucosamine 2-epimerase
MRLVSVVGARPQFVKMAPVARALERHNGRGGKPIESLIVHTGQHYDSGMSDIFFDELEIPPADFNLGVGSGPHGRQTGRMLEKVEQVLLEARPDWVLVYGDTNSSLAGALAAVKLRIPLAHVEAGVRSFDRRMAEELNRVAADHVADLLLAPTARAMDNLAREGLAARAILTGDVMFDALVEHRAAADRRPGLVERLGLPRHGYALATIHRGENTDDRERLARLLTALDAIAETVCPVVVPLHPRTGRLVRSGLAHWTPAARLHLVEPVGYLEMLRLVRHARMTLTDSGGVQREAFFLGCPCITLRDGTEWVETIDGGGNILVGADPPAIRAAVATWERRRAEGLESFGGAASAWFGDGRAADRIVASVVAADAGRMVGANGSAGERGW